MKAYAASSRILHHVTKKQVILLSMSSTITNNHNSLVTNLRNQLLKSFSTLPPPPTSIYRVSLPIDDMTLALLLPPHPTKENQERVILSPVESHNNTSFLSNKSKEGCDNAHEDLLSRLIDAVEKKYSIQEDSCPENFKERISKDWDNAQTKKQILVMGMGENDGGVWFSPYPNKVMSSVEPLLQWELIRGRLSKNHHFYLVLLFIIFQICYRYNRLGPGSSTWSRFWIVYQWNFTT